MTEREAGHIKAKLTRAGWYVQGVVYDGDWADARNEIIAVLANAHDGDDVMEFYGLADCPRQEADGSQEQRRNR